MIKKIKKNIQRQTCLKASNTIFRKSFQALNVKYRGTFLQMKTIYQR